MFYLQAGIGTEDTAKTRIYTFLKKNSDNSYSNIIVKGTRQYTVNTSFTWTVSERATTAASAFTYNQVVSDEVFLEDPISTSSLSTLYRTDENSLLAFYTSPANLRIILNYPNYSGNTSIVVFDMPSNINDDGACFGFYPNGTNPTTLISSSEPMTLSQWGLDITD